VLGHEFAGGVVSSDVAAIPPGTPVAVCPGAPCGTCRACRAGNANLCPRRLVLGYDLPGGMADLVAVPSDWIRTGGIVALDPAGPIERGAVVEPLHTVINGQDQVRILQGERVLVLGLGPIGVLHVAVARSAGAMVLGLDPNPDRVARAAAIVGAERVDRLEVGPDGRAVSAAGAGGFDVVIVAVGAREALATAVASVEPGGRILAFAGLPPAARTIDLDMNDLHYRQLAIQGAFGGTPDTFRRAASWLAANSFDTGAFAPGRFPLRDALRAFEAAAAGHGLKTLLIADDRDEAFANR
jgi:L-iditol 2-dehydrogenase